MAEGLPEVEMIQRVQLGAYQDLLREGIKQMFPSGRFSAKDLSFIAIGLLNKLQAGSIPLEEGTVQVVLKNLSEADRQEIESGMFTVARRITGSEELANSVAGIVKHHAFLRKAMPGVELLFDRQYAPDASLSKEVLDKIPDVETEE